MRPFKRVVRNLALSIATDWSGSGSKHPNSLLASWFFSILIICCYSMIS